MKTFSYRVTIVLVLSALGLTLAAGCHPADTTSAPTSNAAAPSGPTAPDATGTTAAPTSQAPITAKDLNPSLSDKQKAIILAHKSRD